MAKRMDRFNKKRQEATNDFDEDLFKPMHNAVYGKTTEDVRGHIDFELVDTPERMTKLLNAPTLTRRHISNKDLIGVEKIKPVMKLNKPIHVGVSILDLSKLHTYHFYYDATKHKYEDKAQLRFTDTDSVLCHIETNDVYNDFKNIDTHMDCSGYEKRKHPNYDI